MYTVLQVLLLAVGFIMLIKGADFFVDGSSGLAEKLGIPQLVIGLTVVAMGTSAPEAAVSIAAALKGNADITVGNIIGSNILNVLIILGVTSVITPLAIARSTILFEIPFMTAVSILLLLQGTDGTISLSDGIILIVVFLIYLGYLMWSAKNSLSKEKILNKKISVGKAVLKTVIGLLLIVLGSDVTVDAASSIARFLGMSDRFIGLTVVALGTSLPELFTSVTAARKGNADIAVGNIVGSNVFNILFVVGLSALIIPVPFAAVFTFDMAVVIGAGALLFLCSIKNHMLNRWAGILMLCAYVIYFFVIF